MTGKDGANYVLMNTAKMQKDVLIRHVVSCVIDTMVTFRKEIWHNSLKCDRNRPKRGRVHQKR